MQLMHSGSVLVDATGNVVSRGLRCLFLIFYFPVAPCRTLLSSQVPHPLASRSGNLADRCLDLSLRQWCHWHLSNMTLSSKDSNLEKLLTLIKAVKLVKATETVDPFQSCQQLEHCSIMSDYCWQCSNPSFSGNDKTKNCISLKVKKTPHRSQYYISLKR